MKRRDFVIKSSLASSAALYAPTVLAYGTPSANETINVGVIGTGDRGGGLIPFINQIPNMRVVACCDIIPFRLSSGLSKVEGKAKGYSDYKKMLEDKDVDAVLVATPFSTHSKIAIDALKAGKHVYGEKTMAKGYEGIAELVSAAEESNSIFQTGHQYHSSRLYSHVVDEIKNGKIGKITAFECQWNRNGNWRRPVPDPKWERMINWRMYREFSGGLLAELCSHQLDFANWVMGAMPEKVMGIGGIDYWKDGRETYDNIHLIYSYPEGVRASFTCLTSNAMGDYKVKVMGDKGTYILDYAKAWFYPEGSYEKKIGEVDGVSGATLNWDQDRGIPIQFDHEDPSKQALIDFRDNIVNNTLPVSNAKTGAMAATCVQMGLDAMYDEVIMSKPQQG
ncbi:MAG TPA: gfo/Idh/MocA family oxidoreductase [Muricauda sp.]|uniref:Gfo/Idh/MocA family oxidoreductase n=1 Tax=Flagellimonas abyssi TaxID=2864871 RepID=A0ABS7ER55_9FLAO|nr:Gfo/Idh/MocA family oxidoreductase [Allomuricauda abyssi]MBC73259.1 dehydrogenase [Allomuricauda sp.]MBW8200036.1 Gfo/Idh/MocA family oxidoreductase [Allomuricauda abyssi]UBZ15179.1 Gfo/Idh/MocA family oxidoreductase [Allomuricauda aquimarina]HBU79944.1 gfo/Idh/MocA family oxidoreductase [Allomuricauda sp.]